MANLLITQDEPGAPRRKERKLYPEIILREKFRGWETTARLSFDEELSEFLKLVAGKPARLADGKAGVLAIAVAQAVYLSSREHRTVALSEI